jgi:SET domain-containing protein
MRWFAQLTHLRYAARSQSVRMILHVHLQISAVPRRPYRIGRSNAGLGLFATREIKKRAYIVTYRGRRITNAEADALEAKGSRYMFEINSRWTIDGSKRWNVARYVNHSCRPNAEAVERRRGIVYVARRKIRPDEEITVDYGKNYFEAFIGKNRCRCLKCKEKRQERSRRYRARVRRKRVRRSRASRA